MSGRPFSPLSFSGNWLLLGPFQIGTREAAWGADPLERYGGFSALEPVNGSTDQFPSSLAFNGTVTWSNRPFESKQTDPSIIESTLRVTFPEVDFASLRSVYGWAATQFQAWARTDFDLQSSGVRRVLLWTDGVIEFRIDGRHHFGGDFFVLRNAPTALWLEPGRHTIEVRLVRDVRSMGGVGEPEAAVTLKWEILPDERPLLAVEPGIIPDLIEGRGFAGRFASVKVRNDHDGQLEIVRVTSETSILVEDSPERRFVLASGQTREIPFTLIASRRDNSRNDNELEVFVEYRKLDGDEKSVQTSAKLPFVTRKISDAHKFTFRHPSGAVSYAILEPPEEVGPNSEDAHSSQVLLNLHGAGLDVDSEEVRTLFQDLKPLPFWLVHASGMTLWSGDDWHSWGFADAEAAVEAINDWIINMDWKGPKASISRYHLIGHSNGGQGVWYALTHRSDKILSAAAVSGYSHIESYVPYQFWNEMDPAIASTLNVGRLSYRNDLLTDNFAGVPITQQHGSADDNVPPFHSRRLYQLAAQGSSQKPCFLEISAAGHWYDGILRTDHLVEFYNNISNNSTPKVKLPLKYTVIATPNGEVTHRNITILQAHSPYQFGKMEVTRPENDKNGWSFSTSNVRCFSFRHHGISDGQWQYSIVDDQIVQRPGKADVDLYMQDDNGTWACRPDGEVPKLPRQLTQLGGFDALLRTKDTIDINIEHPLELGVAQQLAQNLYQYFRADVAINAISGRDDHAGNKIQIIHGTIGRKFVADTDHKGISFEGNELKLKHPDGRVRRYPYRPGMGLYYLAPLDNGRVEVVVWGLDLAGLQRAARLLPTTTGIGQPDFVVLGEEAGWKGAGGAIAMGFFDHNWRIAAGSFLS